MRTLRDIEEMRLKTTKPFGTQYEFFFLSLENDYITKTDGLNKIKNELKNWDVEAQRYIINKLVDIITDSENMNFKPNELLELVK